MTERQLEQYRLRKVGFVFQFFNLIPSLSAMENLELPMLIAGIHADERGARAETLLETVGLQGEGLQAAGGTIRRRAAARRRLPCAGQRSADHPRRRAHRQSRQQQCKDHLRPADRPCEDARQDRDRRLARSQGRRAVPARIPHARRRHRAGSVTIPLPSNGRSTKRVPFKGSIISALFRIIGWRVFVSFGLVALLIVASCWRRSQ